MAGSAYRVQPLAPGNSPPGHSSRKIGRGSEFVRLYSGVTFVMVSQPALETGFVGVGADPAQEQATVRVSAHDAQGSECEWSTGRLCARGP